MPIRLPTEGVRPAPWSTWASERRTWWSLDADLSSSTRTADFAKEFPERFFNCGIAEQNMMGIAAGMAASGKIVFASTFAVFATGRCCDQVGSPSPIRT